MKDLTNPARRRRRAAIDAAMLFVILLLVTQMWLLTATLEAYLAGHSDVALPGVLVSLALFLACLGLYRLVIRLDRLPPDTTRSSDAGPWKI